MANIINNAVGLIFIFFMIFSLGITFYVIRPIGDQTYQAVNNVAPNAMTDEVYLSWIGLRDMLIQGFYVLVSLVTFMLLVSSFVYSQSWKEYVISAIGGLIVTPLVIYIIATFWNTFAVLGITFQDISMVFVNSWTTIIILNFFMGLLSFIFIKRGQT